MNRRAAIASAIVLVLVAIAILSRRPPAERSTVVSGPKSRGATLVAAAAVQHETATALVGVKATAPPVATASLTAVIDVTPAAAVPQPARLAALAAAEYRKRAQYPPWSRALDDESEDPILRDREVSPNISRGDNGEEPELIAFPDQVNFESPDRVTIYAFLRMRGAAVPPSQLEGEVVDPRGARVAALSWGDEGTDGDALAADAIYTAQLDPQRIDPPLSGSYLVRVHAVTTENDERFGGTGFLYSKPDAQLTGQYSDTVVDGNLEIDAGVRVAAAGRFHLEATLYTRDGIPVAWAQNAASLAPGDHTLSLKFFGRAFHEKQATGPYVLRFVALSTTTNMPYAKNRLVENAYLTHAYDLSQFSEQSFNDADLLDAARRLDGSP